MLQHTVSCQPKKLILANETLGNTQFPVRNYLVLSIKVTRFFPHLRLISVMSHICVSVQIHASMSLQMRVCKCMCVCQGAHIYGPTPGSAPVYIWTVDQVLHRGYSSPLYTPYYIHSRTRWGPGSYGHSSTRLQTLDPHRDNP